MNNLDKKYQELLKDILDNGIEKTDRTGTGTISVFGRQIRHKMSEGFPLLTTKKMYFKGVVTELLWFLKGDTNIKYLVDNDCHIWDGDAYKNYLTEIAKIDSNGNIINMKYPDPPLSKEEFINKIKTDKEFAKKWGDLGPIYGKQWRQWQGWVQYENEGGKGMGSLWNDQISVLLNQLLKNPDSRRLMVSAWNVAEIDDMVLPPCHYGFQVYTRELTHQERVNLTMFEQIEKENLDYYNVPTRAISLMWNQRSVDTFLGLPFNIASYGLLLIILGKLTNMVPDELIGNLGDTHLYSNHIEQAKEQIAREPYNLPELKFSEQVNSWKTYTYPFNDYLKDLSNKDFQIENYKSHPAIKADLSN